MPDVQTFPPVAPQPPANISTGQQPYIPLAIGTVTTGEPGAPAQATISGDPPNLLLNLTLPKGEQGAEGLPLSTVPQARDAAASARFARSWAAMANTARAAAGAFFGDTARLVRRAKYFADLARAALNQAAGFAADAAISKRRAKASAAAAAASAASIAEDQIAFKAQVFN